MSAVRAVTRTLLAGGAATLAGTVLAPAADASIVVQRSIAGVRLDMSEAQVRDRLGEPSETRTRKHEILGTYRDLRYGLTRISIFDGEDRRVFSITTTSRRERTAAGIGVRSRERFVREKVRGVRCATEFGFRSCVVGVLEPGRTVTSFRINRSTGRVTSVTLGRVID